jgi:hypothetical protein
LTCNIYALLSWTIRLGSSHRQYHFIYTRLARTSRPEIPRFRFDFKDVTRDAGDYVHQTLVHAFLNDYLEADGYFFIRLLAANASDFIVQEVLEQLWSIYVMKYGENDAKQAEDAFFQFRKYPYVSKSFSQTGTRSLSFIDKTGGIPESERKNIRQQSDVGVGLLGNQNSFQPIRDGSNEQV